MRYDTQISVETQRLQRHDHDIVSFVASVRSTCVYKSERFSFRDRMDRSA